VTTANSRTADRCFWSCGLRAPSGEVIADHILFTLLEAARWAPSPCNSQPALSLFQANVSGFAEPPQSIVGEKRVGAAYRRVQADIRPAGKAPAHGVAYPLFRHRSRAGQFRTAGVGCGVAYARNGGV
jgi:hypothetical protein